MWCTANSSSRIGKPNVVLSLLWPLLAYVCLNSLQLARDVTVVEDYSGPTWCVTMPHGFIFARRAPLAGLASAPVLMGNCFDAGE